MAGEEAAQEDNQSEASSSVESEAEGSGDEALEQPAAAAEGAGEAAAGAEEAAAGGDEAEVEVAVAAGDEEAEVRALLKEENVEAMADEERDKLTQVGLGLRWAGWMGC